MYLNVVNLSYNCTRRLNRKWRYDEGGLHLNIKLQVLNLVGEREGCDFDPLNLEMAMIYTLFWGSYKRPFTFRW